jgi:hypothetical protein
MTGDNVHLDMPDGRSIPVRVVTNGTANAAAMAGEQFVPVEIAAPPGALSQADVGTAGRLSLSRPILSLIPGL